MGIVSAIAGAFQSFADAVLDKHRATDVAGAIRKKLLPGIRAYGVIASATDREVTFFECIGEREEPSQCIHSGVPFVFYGFGMSTAIHTAGTFPVFSPQWVVARPSANPSPARITTSGLPSWW